MDMVDKNSSMVEWGEPEMSKLNRRDFLRLSALLGVSAATSSLLSGCALSAEPLEGAVTESVSGPQSGGTLVVGMLSTSILTLDPAAYSHRPTETVIRNIFDGLVTRTTDNQVVPELAKGYRWLDELTIEFDLKEGVKFHNGDDFTSEDVVFTFERILTQEVGAPRRIFVKEVGSVEGVDDHTVRFNLKSPWPVFLQLLVHTQIVPKEYLSRQGDENFSQNPVGCGPFRFVDGKLDQEIVLERFDDYYGGADVLPPVGPPFLDRAIFRMMPDPSARVEALQNGTVQIIQNLPPPMVPLLINNPEISIKTVVGSQPKFIELNTSVPPFNDLRVRQALNYAVDVESILSQVGAGYGIVLPGPLSPANHFVDPTLKPYGYDPQKALELLSEAGYTPTEVSFVIDAHGPYVEIAEAVAVNLQNLGMDIRVRVGEYAELRPVFLNCERQAIAHDWGDSAFDPVGYIEAKWQTYEEGTSAGRGNYSCYSNDRVDQLIEAGSSEPDAQKRQEIYNEAQRIIFQEAPVIFLFVPQEIEAASAKVRNWDPSPDSRINLHDVWYAEG
jgi:peptide/nickel transport system substrate-binding protein